MVEPGPLLFQSWSALNMKRHRKTDLRRRKLSTRKPAEPEKQDDPRAGCSRQPEDVGVCPQEEAFLWRGELPGEGEED